MKIGIIPNLTKSEAVNIVELLIEKLIQNNFEVVLSNSLKPKLTLINIEYNQFIYLDHHSLAQESDIIISIGGDGTMLTTAHETIDSNKPILGVNVGKLGFLADVNVKEMDQFISDLINKNYFIENRIVLELNIPAINKKGLLAINDIVIDRGKYPKMIQIKVDIDSAYVTTFSADGVILATPTGSTGYSLSTGGPIVSPQAKVITLSPISPHTLTMRPLVLSCEQVIKITGDSPYKSIQINLDGQRAFSVEPPLYAEIFKSNKSIKLIHTFNTNYFKVLREKLYWGLDIRNS